MTTQDIGLLLPSAFVVVVLMIAFFEATKKPCVLNSLFAASLTVFGIIVLAVCIGEPARQELRELKARVDQIDVDAPEPTRPPRKPTGSIGDLP